MDPLIVRKGFIIKGDVDDEVMEEIGDVVDEINLVYIVEQKLNEAGLMAGITIEEFES